MGWIQTSDIDELYLPKPSENVSDKESEPWSETEDEIEDRLNEIDRRI